MVCALEKCNLITCPSIPELHKSIAGIFVDVGNVRGLQKYLSKQGLSNIMTGHYTNMLKNSDIDHYVRGINENISNLKNTH